MQALFAEMRQEELSAFSSQLPLPPSRVEPAGSPQRAHEGDAEPPFRPEAQNRPPARSTQRRRGSLNREDAKNAKASHQESLFASLAS